MKLEVGKTYKQPAKSTSTFKVLFLGDHKAFGILTDVGETSLALSQFGNGWEEVIPKLTVTKWVNVYKSAPKGKFFLWFGCALYNSKQEGIDYSVSNTDYLDTIEITYTEK